MDRINRSCVVTSRIVPKTYALLIKASKLTGISKSTLIERAVTLWLDVTDVENISQLKKTESIAPRATLN